MTASRKPRRGLTRRTFIGSTGLASQAWAPLANAARGEAVVATVSQEAYASATSVRQGDSLGFHGRLTGLNATEKARVPMAIIRLGWPDQRVLLTAVTLQPQAVPANASSEGCGWPECLRLVIPPTWRSGIYYAAFGSGASVCMVPFVVRPAQPTPGVAMLVQVPVTTSQAYNNYGGKSLYDSNSTDGQRAGRVSFDRPYRDPYRMAFDRWQGPWVRWLEQAGFAADFCTTMDLHREAGLLTPYKLFVTAGHDEYWTREMRQNLDRFVAAGGNAAIFSGNTCWWQSRLEPGSGLPERTLVCHKEAARDPTDQPELKTVAWTDLATPWPENSTTGLSFRLGASWTNQFPRPSAPFIGTRSRHWALEGTDITLGTSFAGTWVGYETDSAAVMPAADGSLHPMGVDGSPPSLRILARADATHWYAAARAVGQYEKPGWAAMAVFSRGGEAGTVFNAGTTDWVHALQLDLDGLTPSPLSRITRNVLVKLSAPHRETADVRLWQGPLLGGGTRHFYSTGCQAPEGMTLQGAAFAGFQQPQPGTLPVQRYRRPRPDGDGWLYALAIGEPRTSPLGWVHEETVFHAYQWPQPGTLPVYQNYQVVSNGHRNYAFTTAPIVAAGWVNDGPVFYVPSA